MVPLTTQHPDYARLLPQWQKCRDFYKGEDFVKKNAHQNHYLRRPEAMEEWAYSEYLNRASLPAIFESTVQGRIGDVFRKPPVTDGPDELTEWLYQVTSYDEDMATVAGRILREIMITGRCAVLLDYDSHKERHNVQLYHAEDIIYWDNTPGQEMVRLREKAYYLNAGSHEVSEEFLDLQMVEGRLQVIRHQLTSQNTWEAEEVTPTSSGSALDFLPIVIVNSERLGFDCNDAPMINLANLMLSFFRNSADYEQGLHALGVPTPVISGMRPEDAKFTLGPYTPMIIEQPDARAYYLEFNGAGMNHLKAAMEEKLLQALMLGARLLQPRRAVESAEAAKTRMGAETSILQRLTTVTEDAVELLMEYFLRWQGKAYDETEFSYELNRDYVAEDFSPDVLRVINESQMAGLISPQTAFKMRKQMEIYPEELTFEEEQELIDTAEPKLDPIPPMPVPVEEEEEENA